MSGWTATPRPTPTPANKSVFNRAPTLTFVPTRLPTLTPIPDFKALFGPLTKEAPEPVNIPLPPADTTVLPHIFVGTMSINSVPAADGVEVTLWTYGFSEPLARSRVSDGTFTLLVPQYGPNSFNGRSLLFKVDNLIADPTASWAAGGADRLHLKVAADKPDPLPTPEGPAQ